MLTPPSECSNPYVGPRLFTTGETLYGWDREVRELLDLLIAERIVLFHSPSVASNPAWVWNETLTGGALKNSHSPRGEERKARCNTSAQELLHRPFISLEIF